MILTTQLHITPCAELLPKVAPVNNQGHIPVKPLFGLWTCTYAKGGSAWVDASKDMRLCNPYELNWFLLDPDPQARVLVINTLADLKELLAEFARPTDPRIPDWMASELQRPDFERMSERWDAMHLTEVGQHHTRLTAPNLYGWDAESTLWFRWCFTDCRRITPPPAPPPDPDEDAE